MHRQSMRNSGVSLSTAGKDRLHSELLASGHLGSLRVALCRERMAQQKKRNAHLRSKQARLCRGWCRHTP